MYRFWLIYDPRRTLIAIAGLLTVLALTIHFICLSSTQFDWLQFKGEVASAAEMSPLPPGR
jgi:light-harvesting complex 1 alpha chain